MSVRVVSLDVAEHATDDDVAQAMGDEVEFNAALAVTGRFDLDVLLAFEGRELVERVAERSSQALDHR